MADFDQNDPVDETDYNSWQITLAGSDANDPFFG